VSTRKTLKALAKRAVKPALAVVGLDVVRTTMENDARLRRTTLMTRAGVDVVIDVGAHVGEYALDLRAAGYAGWIVSYEPLPSAAARLRGVAGADPRWRVHERALDASAGRRVLHVAGNEVSSSLLDMTARHEQSAPHSRIVDRVEVEVGVLSDAIAEARALGSHVFVKIDAQGAEQRILAGAGAALADVCGAQLEMSLTTLYEGAPRMHELVGWMDARGFDLVSLEYGFSDPTSGRLLQVDGLFLRAGLSDKRTSG
jgi:FkbM family methyltransferase